MGEYGEDIIRIVQLLKISDPPPEMPPKVRLIKEQPVRDWEKRERKKKRKRKSHD